jgi:hypothetical protein
MELKGMQERAAYLQFWFTGAEEIGDITRCTSWDPKKFEYFVSPKDLDDIDEETIYYIYMARNTVDYPSIQKLFENWDNYASNLKVKNDETGKSITNEFPEFTVEYNTILLKCVAFVYMFIVPLLEACKKAFNTELDSFATSLKLAANQLIDVYEYASKYGYIFARSSFANQIHSKIKETFNVYAFVAEKYAEYNYFFLESEPFPLGIEIAVERAVVEERPSLPYTMLDFLLVRFRGDLASSIDEFNPNEFEEWTVEGLVSDIALYSKGTRNFFEYVLTLPKDLYLK